MTMAVATVMAIFCNDVSALMVHGTRCTVQPLHARHIDAHQRQSPSRRILLPAAVHPTRVRPTQLLAIRQTHLTSRAPVDQRLTIPCQPVDAVDASRCEWLRVRRVRVSGGRQRRQRGPTAAVVFQRVFVARVCGQARGFGYDVTVGQPLAAGTRPRGCQRRRHLGPRNAVQAVRSDLVGD